jgi:hypothetical protein
MANDNPQSHLGIETETVQHDSVEMVDSKARQDISHVERVLSPDNDLKKEDMDFSRVDKE